MLLTSVATAVGVIIIRRRRPDMKRPYKVWGYPITPLLFIAAYAWIAVRIFLHSPLDSTFGILITLSGVPFYFWWSSKNHEPVPVVSE
jgi:APA family basic amino acid/polyamine antiporter